MSHQQVGQGLVVILGAGRVVRRGRKPRQENIVWTREIKYDKRVSTRIKREVESGG